MSDLPSPGWYERNFRATKPARIAERFYPAVGGVACFVLYSSIGTHTPAYDDIVQNVLPSAVSVAAVLAGFQATAQSIMLAVVGSDTIQRLKQSQHYLVLISYLWETVISLLLFVSLGLFVQWRQAAGAPTLIPERWWLAILAGVLVWSGFSSLRIMFLMVKILRNV